MTPPGNIGQPPKVRCWRPIPVGEDVIITAKSHSRYDQIGVYAGLAHNVDEQRYRIRIDDAIVTARQSEFDVA